jgi:hypothetical protein
VAMMAGCLSQPVADALGRLAGGERRKMSTTKQQRKNFPAEPSQQKQQRARPPSWLLPLSSLLPCTCFHTSTTQPLASLQAQPQAAGSRTRAASRSLASIETGQEAAAAT